MSTLDLPIILYHYAMSPYAKRIVWYLTLRRIPYSQCVRLLHSYLPTYNAKETAKLRYAGGSDKQILE